MGHEEPPARQGSSAQGKRKRSKHERRENETQATTGVVVAVGGAPQEFAQEAAAAAAAAEEEEKQHEYYDHNRNLTLDGTREASTTSTEQQQQQQRRDEIRGRENVSPVSSLSAPNSTSSTTTSTSSCASNSTERMSQTSLAGAGGRVGVGAEAHLHTTTHNDSGSQQQQQQQQKQRAVKFQVGDMLELGPGNERPTAITVQQQQQQQHMEFCDHLQSHLESGLGGGGGGPFAGQKSASTGASLVRQLGRRVSLFPQALARQVSAASGGQRSWAAGGRAHEHCISEQQMVSTCVTTNGSAPAPDPRRFSLPVLGGGGRGGGCSYTSEEDELRSPLRADCTLLAQSAQDETTSEERDLQLGAPTTLVAGVGGTITTVTRSKRKTAPLPRLVAKNGQVNLFLDNIDRRQYMRDLFTTMIDIKWRYNLMAAAFGFVFSWLFFACIWYLVLYFHNDLEHENDPNWAPCIVNVYSFPAALLFSIETQSTLGFGSRIISVECPGAILIFCSQLIFGVVVECLIVGMVFAKLSRPTKRSQTIMYSKFATVCLREGKLCLTFRVGDVRSKSHIIGATLRASLVSSKVTQEGEHIPFYHHKLRVIIDDCKNSLLLIWPVTIVHVIDESSPFYKLNADELINFKFEIITVLEGTVESTGQSIQVRSSYLPSEVKWGYRFEPIVSTHGYGKYAQTIIDYNKFNRILEVPTPKCSALEYYADLESVAVCVSGPDQEAG